MSTLLDVCDIFSSYADADGKSQSSKMVVHNLSFQVQKGEHVCLLGPSGCGKTTTLRAIAGFEPLQGGEITLRGTTLSRQGFTLPPEQRQLGMVFQDYALFPHLTVTENIGFGLSGKHARTRINDMMHLTGLHELANRSPQELSGGQQQRVALARALAPEPSLLLLDEPFSNLDTSLRQSLSHEVRTMLKQTGTSAILVTHDQEEAFAFADYIGLMRSGKMVQWGTAHELYQQPVNDFVASFIGEGSLIQGTRNSQGLIETAAGLFNPSNILNAPKQRLMLRPNSVTCDPASPHKAIVRQISFRGQNKLLKLQLSSGEELLLEIPAHCTFTIGETTGLRPAASDVPAFVA
ncbi:ABC transporter ATP-binding protein [Sansalvadorimonas verongulae]|uniref:ABC transporter ATP-binding protein n=1 Tax=Sansalvadorimonas verongulae TaxID=2172824 RepID=UPI0012BCAA5C|nr:ABC transporter ATP-binding protein [Sansalvadorimonas verongulae]MTI13548.1 ABC transporter ATP-binding protein [Sansalvadorimonas verongulae]